MELPLKKLDHNIIKDQLSHSSIITINFTVTYYKNFPYEYSDVYLISRKHWYLKSFVTDRGIMLRFTDLFSIMIGNNGESIDVFCTDIGIDRAISYTLGMGLSICFIKNLEIPLHCSSIKYNSGNYVFVAESGVGKSTLLFSFLKQGAHLISDDVLPIINVNKLLVVPSISIMPRLWMDTIKKLGFHNNIFKSISSDLDKYYMDVDKRVYRPITIDKIFFLENHQSDDIVLKQISTNEIFIKILENVHALWALPKEDKLSVLNVLSNIHHDIRGYKLKYQKTYQSIYKIIDIIDNIP